MKKIGILTTTSPIVLSRFESEAEDIRYAQEILSDLLNRLNERADEDIKFLPIMYMNLEFSIVNQDAQIVDSQSGMDLREFDLIYVKSWKRFQDAASAISVYLDATKTAYDPQEISRFRPVSKITEAYVMWSQGLRIPDTFYSPANHRLKDMLERADFDERGIVVKDEDGFGGNTNFLIQSVHELDDILKKHNRIDFVAQNFIPNDCDYRVLLFDAEPKLVIERKRAATGTHLNNTTQGAQAEKIELNDFDQKVLDECVTLAKSLKRTTAGVDVMRNSETGEMYFLEINKSPQIGSGAFMDEKLDIFYEYLTDKLK